MLVGRGKLLSIIVLHFCKSGVRALLRHFISFVEIQNVRLWKSFSAKTKLLVICGNCSTFAVELAKKMQAVRRALEARARYTLLIYMCA